MQLGQMCASLSSCQKEEFQFCDRLINTNTKNNLKNFHHEQNTLPNTPLEMIIRASEVEEVDTPFPVHSLKNNITGWTI